MPTIYGYYYVRDDQAATPDAPGGELINDEADEGSFSVAADTDSAQVQVTVRTLQAAPERASGDWDRTAETELVSSSGQVYVCEWGAGPVDDLPNLAASGPGAYMIRVHSRKRSDTEEHLIEVWPS
ncbi:hypothetical protein [Actinoallomurus sp. NPDC052274]|uniref:hypothetical protein n=1 Tax=Actinoallomurus sp. NPDC052274 TaxID=3155420 RepID=UPI00343B2954